MKPAQVSSNGIVTGDAVNGIYSEVIQELGRAIRKFPQFPIDPIHMVAVMAEESGESVKAALQCMYEGRSHEDIETELVQTAAMCFRCIAHLRAQ